MTQELATTTKPDNQTPSNAVLERPMPNPFPGTEGAVEEQDAVLIATDGYSEEDALPPWLDPTKFSFTGELGFTLYSIIMDRTLSTSGAEISLEDDGISDDVEADQFSARLAVAYTPFVFNKVALGIFAGYQAIPSIRGHDLQAGLGMTIDASDLISFGVNAQYAHMWVRDIGITSVSGLEGPDQSLPAEVFQDMLPDELSLNGVGGNLSMNFNLTEYFKLGPYVNANFYFSSDSKMTCITPGIHAVTDF